jgi:hypothetical protein
MAGTTCDSATLASVPSVDEGSGSHCGDGYDRGWRCSGLCSLGRRGLSQPLWWRIRQVRELLWPQFAWSACAQLETVVAGTKCEGAALASVRLFGIDSASHCSGGHDRCGRCSGLCSLVRRGLSQPLWWRSQQVRALLWPVFARSAWAQPASVLAVTVSDGAALASVPSVGVGLASPCGGGTTGESAALSSVRLVGKGSASH